MRKGTRQFPAKVNIIFEGISAGLAGITNTEVELDNGNVKDLLNHLIKKYPKIRILFREPLQTLRSYAKVRLNGKEIGDADLSTILHDGDRIGIVMHAYAGG